MRKRNRTMVVLFTALSLLIFLAMPNTVLAADATVNLGTSAEFAVLAGTTITNTGPTSIGGDVGGNIGVSPGSEITGITPDMLSNGTIHTADAVALQAQADLVIAYKDAASRAVTKDMTGQNLGGMTLTPGVYSFSSAADLTGTLVLDAKGDPDGVFIFQIASTLITAPSSVVSLVNSARFCRIFWQVGSSATLGTNSDFVGHIFALTSIAAQTGASVQGQLLARNGAITLDTNAITNGVCEVTTTDETTTETTETDTAETTAANTDDTTSTTENEEIPKTGESDNYILYGILLLGVAGSLAFFIRRRQAR